jgi:hypothetical protein
VLREFLVETGDTSLDGCARLPGFAPVCRWPSSRPTGLQPLVRIDQWWRRPHQGDAAGFPLAAIIGNCLMPNSIHILSVFRTRPAGDETLPERRWERFFVRERSSRLIASPHASPTSRVTLIRSEGNYTVTSTNEGVTMTATPVEIQQDTAPLRRPDANLQAAMSLLHRVSGDLDLL